MNNGVHEIWNEIKTLKIVSRAIKSSPFQNIDVVHNCLCDKLVLWINCISVIYHLLTKNSFTQK